MAILAECPICHKKQGTKNKECSCGEDLDKAKGSKRVRYWIDYRLPNGKRKREAVSGEDVNPYSIESAREMHSKRVVQRKENRIIDIKPDINMTFNELSKWYLALEKVKALPSFWHIELCLKKFNSQFGDMIVSRIKPADLENYQARRKAKGKADATIDHEVGSAKAMINKAFDNDMVSGDTLRVFKAVKTLLKKGSNARDRVLSPGEFESLYEHAPRHIKSILSMGYYAGMRKGEILPLTWNKVNLKGRVIGLEAADTKDNEPRAIPICDELLKVLKGIPRGIHTVYVFLYKGRPVKDIRNAIKKACEGAKILYGRDIKGGFVFHDLRHTFKTNMRKAGTPESVIMKITGHSTREMFDRYNTIDRDDTRAAIDQLEGYLLNGDHGVDQIKENEK
jgi:integrase